ncbi:MAG: hypothetical protein RTU09_10100 [Candidatus Thorarchaeota archaeon]
MNTTFLVIGIILLALGLLSWIIYIPIFSDFWIGEVGGLFLIYLGWKDKGQSEQAPAADFTPDSGQQI